MQLIITPLHLALFSIFIGYFSRLISEEPNNRNKGCSWWKKRHVRKRQDDQRRQKIFCLHGCPVFFRRVFFSHQELPLWPWSLTNRFFLITGFMCKYWCYRNKLFITDSLLFIAVKNTGLKRCYGKWIVTQSCSEIQLVTI